MKAVEVSFRWRIRGHLHIGTGMSRLGEADRLIRLDAQKTPIIDGEQVKGAVRGAAERLIRWLGATVESSETDSYPRHPVLVRIFAPRPDALIRFEPARMDLNQTRRAVQLASTAIGSGGAADEHTLRVIEALEAGAEFQGKVSLYGAWKTEQDRQDLRFLGAAILACEGIGGRKGVGFGRIECLSLVCKGATPELNFDVLANSQTIVHMRAALAAGGK